MCSPSDHSLNFYKDLMVESPCTWIYRYWRLSFCLPVSLSVSLPACLSAVSRSEPPPLTAVPLVTSGGRQRVFPQRHLTLICVSPSESADKPPSGGRQQAGRRRAEDEEPARVP